MERHNNASLRRRDLILARAPYRLSIGGGGSDFKEFYETYGGAVLSTSINKYIRVSVRNLPPFFKHKSRIVWSRIEQVNSLDEIAHPAVRESLKWLGINDVEIHYDGDLPAQCGLGSSSTFAVALLNALYSLQGKMTSKRQLAEDAIYLERELCKEYGGVQDQIAAAQGGLNKLTFHKGGGWSVTPIVLPHDILQAFESSILLFYLGRKVSSSVVSQKHVERISQNEKTLIQMRDMVDTAIDYLSKGDIEAVGRLLHESWLLKRSLTNLVSNDYLDGIYATAMQAGAWGGKVAGGGAGGSMFFLVSPDRRDILRKALSGLLEVPFRFEREGARIVYYEPEEDGQASQGYERSTRYASAQSLEYSSVGSLGL